MPSATLPRPSDVVAHASDLGVVLSQLEQDGKSLAFTVDNGGTVVVALMPIPDPNVPTLHFGPTSPDREEAIAAPAHYIVALQNPSHRSRLQADEQLARVSAAVVSSSSAVAAMLGHGTTIHHADFFVDAVRHATPGQLPVELVIDVTVAAQDGRTALLTHGLTRYGREELLIVARDPMDGLSLALSVADLILSGDQTLSDGDTVGRSATERLTVSRIPSPLADGSIVIHLTLD